MINSHCVIDPKRGTWRHTPSYRAESTHLSSEVVTDPDQSVQVEAGLPFCILGETRREPSKGVSPPTLGTAVGSASNLSEFRNGVRGVTFPSIKSPQRASGAALKEVSATST